jgi:hypothetical protein
MNGFPFYVVDIGLSLLAGQDIGDLTFIRG